MKKMIVLLVLILCIQVNFCLAESESQSLPPPLVLCQPEIAWQAHLLILPLFMSVVSYDNSVNFDRNSEIKIIDKEIVKLFQIYINEKTIFAFLLVMPAGIDALPGLEKIIDVEVNTADGYDTATVFYLYVLGWPL